MKSEEPPKPPPQENKIEEIISNENLSDEQFEDKLTEELRKKRQQELDDNMIFALRNTI